MSEGDEWRAAPEAWEILRNKIEMQSAFLVKIKLTPCAVPTASLE
jgi:hypothetical protein